MKALAIVCGLAGCALIGCSNHSSKELPSDVTRAFEEAIASDNPDNVSKLFTDDAEVMTQERPIVKGKQDIRQYFTDQMSPVIMFDSTTEMSVVSGNLAFESGTYTFRDTRRGADIEFGKYINVWRKQGEHWKIFRAMYNTDEPIEANVTVAHDGE